MARSKKPRNKPYRPRPVDRFNMSVAQANVSLLTTRDKQRMMAVLHNAFASLQRGTLTQSEWTDLAGMFNTACCLADLGVGSNLLPVFGATGIAMLDIRDRLVREGRVTAYAAQQEQIAEAIALVKMQLDLCTYKELFAAEAAIQHRDILTATDTSESRHKAVKIDVAEIYEVSL